LIAVKSPRRRTRYLRGRRFAIVIPLVESPLAAVRVASDHHAPRRATPSLGEEIASAVTHGVGALLAIAGLALLVAQASWFGDGPQLAAAIVFGAALFLLYVASTLYHALPFPHAKQLFKLLDHSAIYLLIAGTYTPFTLVTLRRCGGWWLFGVIWSLAALGITLEVAFRERPRWLNALVFVAMGWLVLGVRGPLAARLGAPGLWLLVAGGGLYTVGTLFYVSKRRYMHAVWHLFVLGGSLLHFLAVQQHVLFWRGAA
jgi:hemolysin III